MNKKAMALLPVLLIALSMVGFAYAHWQEYIYINGTVKTAEFLAGFTAITGEGDNEGTALKPQDIGKVRCWLEDPVTNKDGTKTVYKKMWMEVTFGYPCYEAWNEFTIDNAGSMPVHIKSADITGDSLLVPPPINVWIDPDPVSTKIEPCSSATFRIYVHIKQDALPCNTYTFEVKIGYEQPQ